MKWWKRWFRYPKAISIRPVETRITPTHGSVGRLLLFQGILLFRDGRRSCKKKFNSLNCQNKMKLWIILLLSGPSCSLLSPQLGKLPMDVCISRISPGSSASSGESSPILRRVLEHREFLRSSIVRVLIHQEPTTFKQQIQNQKTKYWMKF